MRTTGARAVRAASPPEPIWVTDGDLALSARIYRPSGPARGGVVVCGPWGYDATRLHRTRRLLAHGLAAGDLVVLDLDHPDTGSSNLEDGRPDALQSWRRGLRAGVAWMHAAGVAQPTIVGIGLGALLAADVAHVPDKIGPLVLWASPKSGSEVARRLRAMALVTPGAGSEADQQTINAFGHRIHRHTLASLKTWDPWRSIPASCDVSLVDEPGRVEPGAIGAALQPAGVTATVLEASGLRRLLDADAEDGIAPLEAVRVVAAAVCAGARPAASVSPPAGPRRILLNAVGGSAGEEFVRFGDHDGPVGVLATPVARPQGPAAVIFINNGVNDASGPARLWLRWSRRLAAEGIACLRLDLRGLGNSPLPARGTLARAKALPREAGPDLDRAVAQLRADGARRVILVGLFSGSYLWLANAAYSPDPGDHVIGLNPPLYAARNVGVGPWNPLTFTPLGWVMIKRPLREAAHRLPRAVHRPVDAAYLYPAPDRMLWRASRRVRCEVVLAAGDREADDIRARGRFGFAEPGHHGLVNLWHVEGLDHSLFDYGHHDVVFDMVRSAATEPFATPARPWNGPGDSVSS